MFGTYIPSHCVVLKGENLVHSKIKRVYHSSRGTVREIRVLFDVTLTNVDEDETHRWSKEFIKHKNPFIQSLG